MRDTPRAYADIEVDRRSWLKCQFWYEQRGYRSRMTGQKPSSTGNYPAGCSTNSSTTTRLGRRRVVEEQHWKTSAASGYNSSTNPDAQCLSWSRSNHAAQWTRRSYAPAVASTSEMTWINFCSSLLLIPNRHKKTELFSTEESGFSRDSAHWISRVRIQRKYMKRFVYQLHKSEISSMSIGGV